MNYDCMLKCIVVLYCSFVSCFNQCEAADPTPENRVPEAAATFLTPLFDPFSPFASLPFSSCSSFFYGSCCCCCSLLPLLPLLPLSLLRRLSSHFSYSYLGVVVAENIASPPAWIIGIPPCSPPWFYFLPSLTCLTSFGKPPPHHHKPEPRLPPVWFVVVVVGLCLYHVTRSLLERVRTSSFVASLLSFCH
ncbi:uncharacterized protein BP01DRAFT_119023 [Aspergillus saccharolyticus JOP 1030-1]|uniref:Uncharacterized protein n=1 Tax=Aspergillus saccharolyticus JOP 1030-1 TaxID=1450539 RepID=A0A318ZN66_9EURO|nr:hypothetical protein BP01DRAFT_119023 [Aspergillus saccharolyticus JOP 1030-1]PYH49039.1 hypothetical protein BP01DRAFT_119023 [Aspergillus saccharolyticus JOP 1030-1]